MRKLDEISGRDAIRAVTLIDGTEDVLRHLQAEVGWAADLRILQQERAIRTTVSRGLLPSASIVEAESHSVTCEVVASPVPLGHQWDEIVLDVGPDAAGICSTSRRIPDRWSILLSGDTRDASRVVQAIVDAVIGSSATGAGRLDVADWDEWLSWGFCTLVSP